MTRLVYPSDDRRAAGTTTAMQFFSASDRARLRADNLELRARRRGDARSIIQFGFGVEVNDPDHELARAMEAAHAELRKRCPKSEVARMDFSVDDDD
jgi:hypothetical protein